MKETVQITVDGFFIRVYLSVGLVARPLGHNGGARWSSPKSLKMSVLFPKPTLITERMLLFFRNCFFKGVRPDTTVKLT